MSRRNVCELSESGRICVRLLRRTRLLMMMSEPLRKRAVRDLRRKRVEEIWTERKMGTRREMP